MSFHSDTVLVCQTPAKPIVYYHALVSAFSCLQKCTLRYWGMFSLFVSFPFLSAKCWCSVFIHTLIDVASIRFAEECCHFVLLSLEHIGMVLCLHGAGLFLMTQQMVSRTDCVIHSFIYLFQTFLLRGTTLISPIIFSWFPKRPPGKIQWMCCVGETVTPEPFDHVVLSCLLPGEKKKKYFFFCGLLWRCDFSSQVAFTSLCRRRKRLKTSALFYFIFVPPCLFSQSDGGYVTLLTLTITIKESLAGGNASC